MNGNLGASGPSADGLPLDGVRIIDFSRLLPGPWCTQMLADMGAEVIKVEQPGIGDLGRHNPPRYKDTSVYFNSVNGGKRSIALDLSGEEGRTRVHDLIREADVVIESFRKGVPARLGIDYDSANWTRPEIIYCSITGFGQTGPLAPIPGHDLAIQAVSGVMGIAPRQAQEAPAMPGFQAADYAAACYGVMGILGALLRRRTTGRGCYIDLSMFDSLFSMTNLVSSAAMARAAGGDGQPAIEIWGKNPRYATYVTRDGGAVAVSLLEARAWAAFCQLIGRPDLVAGDEGPEDRLSAHPEQAERYRRAIADVCLAHNRDELVRWMTDNDVPVLPVHTPDEAIRCDHVQARDLLRWTEHPTDGRIPMLANPLVRAGLAEPGGRRPAPALDQDREEICNGVRHEH